MPDYDAFGSFMKDSYSFDDDTVLGVFKAFDQDNDGYLNSAEVEKFFRELFKKNTVEYGLNKQQLEEFRYLVDLELNGVISLSVFSLMWTNCVNSILNPTAALILVDVQNDYYSSIDNDLKLCVINKLNYLMSASFDHVIYATDSFPDSHIAFIENLLLYFDKLLKPGRSRAGEIRAGDNVVFKCGLVEREVKMVTKTCVQNSHGETLVKDLNIISNSYRIYKGTDPLIPSYSAFWDATKSNDTGLLKLLRDTRVTDVFVTGFGTSKSVKATALDAANHGFRTVLVSDACCELEDQSRSPTKRRVNDVSANGNSEWQELQKRGIAIASTDDVQNMLACRDRRPELGYISALNYAISLKKLTTFGSVANGSFRHIIE